MAETTKKRHEFTSIGDFRKHYYPKPESQGDSDRDIRAAAEHLAARTLRTVRRQLAAH
jgi:hypothetical protein